MQNGGMGECMERAIGVIGGVGPYAGIDLVQKIFDSTVAHRDQDHIDLYMTSTPARIEDRTEYLLHGGGNPAEGLYQSLKKLVCMGASVIAIPCNTAHAPAIYDRVKQRAAQEFPGITLLNMIEETCAYIAALFPEGAEIGLLATRGTHAVGLYRQYLASYPRLSLMEPTREGQLRVHDAIYNPQYGVKAVSPPRALAVEILLAEGRVLIEEGAKALILGCTELPLALQYGMLPCPLVDPTLLLARAAVGVAAPEKLSTC